MEVFIFNDVFTDLVKKAITVKSSLRKGFNVEWASHL